MYHRYVPLPINRDRYRDIKLCFREDVELFFLPANSQDVELFLWNPASRECKTSHNPFGTQSSSLGHGHRSVCGVGYDPFTDNYKVVMLTSYYTEPSSSSVVYSLKTNAWRRIQDIHYALAASPCGGILKWVSPFPFELSLPTCPDDSENDTYYTLEVLGDRLCLVFSHRHDQVQAWMMEDYGVRILDQTSK
ncbi:F-box/kelch-repeat protein At3g06240-like [Rhododendron vialii]|uniref:F-box/kelch-repeat protein At3g06240-like n=1 Tax=Rhododendron vialii TaxID=182163 RepID=UPI00265FA1F9|nr:F-box/kelch-repeat protein At3g06240-like [Rhododendron vialii]